MKDKKYSTIMYSGAWILLVVVLSVSMGFVNHSRKQAKCTGLSIKISNEEGNFFVEDDDVRDFIYASVGDPIGQVLNDVDLAFMEAELGNMDVLRNAEVFADLKGHINIEIEQRIPIARLFFKDGSSNYMDVNGELMPLSSKYTSRVIVINGNVPSPIMDESEFLNPEWVKLHDFVLFIRNDDFFNAQFEQVYINSNTEFELTPRVGRHSILLGKTEEMDTKLKKLKLFYKEGIAKVDWNKYKQIDLRFKDQIVCAKR